jgi:cation:H+ antiporter
MVSTVVSLVVLSVLIVVVAVRMTRVADRIAETTGMARGLVGTLLLAVATSLPELVTSLTAVLLCGAPGLAFGNVFGSNVVNLAFIPLMDVFIVGSIFVQAGGHHVRTIRWIVAFTLLALALIALPRWVEGAPPLVGKTASVLMIALYFTALREITQQTQADSHPASGAVGGRVPWPEFGACAAGVLVLGLLLTRACADFARLSGLGQTFVGTLVLALVTSLPELVVSLESVRLGSVDMALGNIVGSNLFNLTILAMCDLACLRGSLYAAPEAISCWPAALASLFMILVTRAALGLRPSATIVERLSWPSLVLALSYLAANLITYLS